MEDTKPFASLGPTLLARKGGAKPAMRPQVSATTGGAQAVQKLAEDLEDLGWNDMGEDDAPADRSAEVLQLTPAPHNLEAEASTDKGSPKPLVRSIHEELAEMLAKGETEYLVQKDKPKPAPKPVARPKPVAVVEEPVDESAEDKANRRAAFTLRLDAKRHLKLRLASTVHNRSAQQLVTEALDRFLRDIPEIELLARNIQRNDRKGV